MQSEDEKSVSVKVAGVEKQITVKMQSQNQEMEAATDDKKHCMPSLIMRNMRHWMHQRTPNISGAMSDQTIVKEKVSRQTLSPPQI